MISEKACREFCAANYEGVKCSAYAIGNKPISQCFLYSEYPHSTGNGSMTIYRKVCRRSPRQYFYRYIEIYQNLSVLSLFNN